MHIQIVNFSLDGLDPRDYEKHCEQLAPAFAAMPGLIAKFWLSSPASNTYGGVYLWQDRSAFEAYEASDTFAWVKSNPRLTNVSSLDFDILESPSEITRAFRFESTAEAASSMPVV
jgi:hypothetical protein